MSFEYRLHFPAKYDIRDFERALELQELLVMFPAATLVESGSEVILQSDEQISLELLDRLTFIEAVELPDGSTHQPKQVLFDKCGRSSKALGSISTSRDFVRGLGGAQVTRREHCYFSHDFHQYKGKYYPQLVKVLSNMGGIPSGGIVLDPFSGSGTTLVEAYLNNFVGLGVDMNPLAVFMSNMKVRSLELDITALENDLTFLEARLAEYEMNSTILRFAGAEEVAVLGAGAEEVAVAGEYQHLPNHEYLVGWFTSGMLHRLDYLLGTIQELSPAVQDLALLTLSNMLRNFSLQDPGDLRIRRRKTAPDPTPFFSKFGTGLRRNAASVFLFRAMVEQQGLNTGHATCYHGDCRKLSALADQDPRFAEPTWVDGIITSPPYATALPYIDTDRLSLFLLGLMTRQGRKEIEASMIGHREITTRERDELEGELLGSPVPLPEDVLTLLRNIHRANTTSEVGFRRRNMASLLYRYFRDMYWAFQEWFRVLKPSGNCYVVIGNSRTVAGTEEVEIPTDHFLGLIGQSVGFEYQGRHAMTDQVNYMAHTKNMITTESIVILRKA